MITLKNLAAVNESLLLEIVLGIIIKENEFKRERLNDQVRKKLFGEHLIFSKRSRLLSCTKLKI